MPGGRSIVVVGSCNTDLVVRVPRIPQPGETILGGDYRQVAGGKGANQAVAARRAGAPVSMIACLGDDAFGDATLAGLAREGVETQAIRRAPGAASGVALIAVAENGENSIVVAPGANGLLAEADCERAYAVIQQAGFVIAQLEVPLPTVTHAFRLARAAGATTILNPAPAQPLPEALFTLTDILIGNEGEVAALTGLPVGSPDEALAAARVLYELGIPTVIVTLGDEGAVLFERDETLALPAHAVPVHDTTAAGDAFIGAFAAALAAGEPFRRALAWGNAAGALAVQRAGAQASLPTREEIAALLAQHPQAGA